MNILTENEFKDFSWNFNIDTNQINSEINFYLRSIKILILISDVKRLLQFLKPIILCNLYVITIQHNLFYENLLQVRVSLHQLKES